MFINKRELTPSIIFIWFPKLITITLSRGYGDITTPQFSQGILNLLNQLLLLHSATGQVKGSKLWENNENIWFYLSNRAVSIILHQWDIRQWDIDLNSCVVIINSLNLYKHETFRNKGIARSLKLIFWQLPRPYGY